MIPLLERLSQGFAWLGGAAAFGVAAMTVTSISMRATVSQPIPGDVEITQFGIALSITLCLPWCQMNRANIIVDFFTAKVSDEEFDRHVREVLTVMRSHPRYVLGVADQVPPDALERRIRRVGKLVEDLGAYD